MTLTEILLRNSNLIVKLAQQAITLPSPNELFVEEVFLRSQIKGSKNGINIIPFLDDQNELKFHVIGTTDGMIDDGGPGSPGKTVK